MPYVSDTTRRCVRSLTSCARRSVPAVRSRASARRRFPRYGSRKNIAAAPASAASRNWNMAPLLSALLPAALRFTLAYVHLLSPRLSYVPANCVPGGERWPISEQAIRAPRRRATRPRVRKNATRPLGDDERGHHPEHPVTPLRVREDVAVERPHTRLVAVDDDVPALAGVHSERVAGEGGAPEGIAIPSDHVHRRPVQMPGVHQHALVHEADIDALAELRDDGLRRGEAAAVDREPAQRVVADPHDVLRDAVLALGALGRILRHERDAVHLVRQALAVEVDAGRLGEVVLEGRAHEIAGNDAEGRTRPGA